MMVQAHSKKVTLGIIGGSGLYHMPGVNFITEHSLTTPFGQPSAAIAEADIAGRRVFFLPRHGKGHRLTPSEIPYRANIAAMKSLGVTHLLAMSAVGIMRPEIKPGDMVIPDQLIDMTKGQRASSFWGGGAVGHVRFAEPFCPQFSKFLAEIAAAQSKSVHASGTYICIEGPRFSSRAESQFYRRSMDPSIIGMTAMPEAALAREAEIAYALLGLATDYDCWHEEQEEVSVEAVMQVMQANADTAYRIALTLAQQLPEELPAIYHGLAQQSLVTAAASLSPDKKKELAYLLGTPWA